MYYNVHLAARPITKLLEVGVMRGHSLRAWKSLYPRATIVGVERDMSMIKRKLHDITVVEGDARTKQVADTIRNMGLFDFDLIIDDASLNSTDAIVTMQTMAPLLKHDGLYVVEYIPDPDALVKILEHGLDMFSTVHRYKSMAKKTAKVLARKDDGSAVHEFSYYSDILFFEHKHELSLNRPDTHPPRKTSPEKSAG
jgi:trans-aconitate methyltransferase